MLTPNITKVAYKGGGAKGFIDIGVGLEFDRLGLTPLIDIVAGTSVGAIFSLYFASGKSAIELQKIAFSTDFVKIIYNHWEIINLYDLVTKGGLHDGKDLQKYIRDFICSITGNENTTYAEWHELKLKHPELGLKDIFVEACNISRNVNEVFSYRNKRLKDVPIWKGVAASSAFPAFFEPIEVNGELYSDGGLQDNCPIDLFNIKGDKPNPEAIGIWLASTAEINFLNQNTLPPVQPISNPIQIFEAQIASQLEGDTFRLLDSAYKNKMILCDNCGIGTLDFSLSHNQKKKLVLSGMISVFFYFADQYPEFTAEHYSQTIFDKIGITAENLKTHGFDDETYIRIIEKLKLLPTHFSSVLMTHSPIIAPMRERSLQQPPSTVRPKKDMPMQIVPQASDSDKWQCKMM